MSRRERRTDFILDALSAGIPSPQIGEMIEARLRHGQISLERGLQSEWNVCRSLAELPMVQTIRVDRAYGLHDRRGRDLVVELDGSYPFNKVDVQVKSSYRGIRSFKQQLAQRCGVEETDVEDILRDRKMVVINGQLSEDLIRESFLEQLERMVYSGS